MGEYKGRVLLDTNILMGTKNVSQLFEAFEGAKLSVTIGTLMELDRLKTAEGQRGFEARSALRILRAFPHMITVYDTKNPERMTYDQSTVDGDLIYAAKTNEDITVITNDLSLESMADANGVYTNTFFEKTNSYRKGYTVYDWDELGIGRTSEEKRAEIYKNLSSIPRDEVRTGEYAVIRVFGVVEMYFCRRKDGSFEPVRECPISSTLLGKYHPKKGDIAQMVAFDMLGKKDISLLTGPAGSGKTLLALAKQFEMLDTGKIGRITIFVNPEKASGAKSLGFYKGDRNQKLMQESIGGILASKIGDRDTVEQMVEDGLIEIMPVSDIRGYEVPEFSSLYITEAQNLDRELMKLAIQRAGEGVKVFIEGDPTTQLDSWRYEGDNNGMLSLIETFSGSDYFGNVNLETIYRSPVAELAEFLSK